MPGGILIVDDDRALCETLEAGLVRRGFRIDWTTSAEEALQRLKEKDFDVVVADLNMPGLGGVELCRRIVANRPGVFVVLITAFGSLETAIAAIRAGAYDFIVKPFEIDALSLALERAIQHRALKEEVKRLREAAGRERGYEEMIGGSPAMRDLYTLLDRVADTETSILITGETGTGKEVVARALHNRSRRRQGPFVPINCTAVPESLLESELFGHVKGAFTGAVGERKGLFLAADKGTLFLDEIADMPMTLQSKLLRSLQERKVRPVGGDREIPIDVRLISATHRDLESEIDAGRFRKDLFFRINVVQVALPPLRARGNDILLLAQEFLGEFASATGNPVKGLNAAAAERLLSYSWPGNVRELRNCMERAVALARHDQITGEDLPDKIRGYKSTQFVLEGENPLEFLPMKQVERRYIERALAATRGNRTLAAKILGFDRKTLYRKIRQFGIRIDEEP